MNWQDWPSPPLWSEWWTSLIEWDQGRFWYKCKCSSAKGWFLFHCSVDSWTHFLGHSAWDCPQEQHGPHWQLSSKPGLTSEDARLQQRWERKLKLSRQWAHKESRVLLYLLVELFVQVLVWWQCGVMGASIRWWWEKAHKSPTGGREKEDYHITAHYWESWAKKKSFPGDCTSWHV